MVDVELDVPGAWEDVDEQREHVDVGVALQSNMKLMSQTTARTSTQSPGA